MKGRKSNASENTGVNEAAMDLADKPERRNNAAKIFAEAEERKRGGRTARKRGGHVKEHMVEGEKAKHHAGRKPRKSGGACENSPYTTAAKTEVAKGRKVEPEMLK